MSSLIDTLRSDPAIARREASRLGRIATGFAAHLTWRRVAFAFALATLVSTQPLFVPHIDSGFLPEHFLGIWRDYFVECAVMAACPLLALTLAEAASDGAGRGAGLVALLAALFGGSLVGALLVLPWYGLGWDDAFGSRFWGDVAYWSALGLGVATIASLQRRAAAAAAALHQAEVARVALSRQMMEARLQVMRAQIEPHFLFNTLANVKRLCQTDVAGGVTMLDNLTRYLRAALPQMRGAQTTLGQEADLVQAYLAVLQIRMGGRLRHAVSIPPALRSQPFPPMMLLTLAENAIKHGLTPAPHGGTLDVRARATASRLLVEVADTGVGFGAAATGGSGVGLDNTRARLAALHGEAAELSLEANLPSGVVASIRLPLTPARS